MDALELIKQDQDAIKKMFDDALANNDPAARAGLLQHIRAELTAHRRMKDDVFYPALRAGGDKAKSIMLDGMDSQLRTDVISMNSRGPPQRPTMAGETESAEIDFEQQVEPRMSLNPGARALSRSRSRLRRQNGGDAKGDYDRVVTATGRTLPPPGRVDVPISRWTTWCGLGGIHDVARTNQCASRCALLHVAHGAHHGQILVGRLERAADVDQSCDK